MTHPLSSKALGGPLPAPIVHRPVGPSAEGPGNVTLANLEAHHRELHTLRVLLALKAGDLGESQAAAALHTTAEDVRDQVRRQLTVLALHDPVVNYVTAHRIAQYRHLEAGWRGAPHGPDSRREGSEGSTGDEPDAQEPRPRYRYEVVGDYSGPLCATLDDLCQSLRAECETMEDGDVRQVRVWRKDVSDAVYHTLPEWQGP